jgi:hypothetical protein
VKAEVASVISTGTSGTTVAVKMLKEGHTDNDMIDLVSIELLIALNNIEKSFYFPLGSSIH